MTETTTGECFDKIANMVLLHDGANNNNIDEERHDMFIVFMYLCICVYIMVLYLIKFACSKNCGQRLSEIYTQLKEDIPAYKQRWDEEYKEIGRRRINVICTCVLFIYWFVIYLYCTQPAYRQIFVGRCQMKRKAARPLCSYIIMRYMGRAFRISIYIWGCLGGGGARVPTKNFIIFQYVCLAVWQLPNRRRTLLTIGPKIIQSEV